MQAAILNLVHVDKKTNEDTTKWKKTRYTCVRMPINKTSDNDTYASSTFDSVYEED